MASADRPTLARALLLGCRAGLLVFLALYTLCAVFNMKLGYQGNESQVVSEYVWSEWRGVVLGQVARLIGAYTVLGLAAGAFLGAGLWAAGAGRRAVFWGSALACLGVDVLLVLGDMAHHPHLYAATLYERSAVTRQVLLSVSGTPPLAWGMAAAVAPALAVLALLARALRAAPGRALAAGGALAVLLGMGTLVRAAGTPPEKAAARAKGPHLLILSADGLRPDHFSGNGYPRPTTPNIDRLLREGTQFQETVVQVPRTAPSWTTLLTSQWAGEHPIRHTLVGREAREQPLTTLATALNEAGWTTAVVADYAGDHFSRLDYGFQHVEAPAFHFPDLIRQRMLITHVPLLPWTALAPGLFPERGQFPELTDPAPLLRRTRRMLEGMPADAPFALVVFGSTPHFPYAAPWPEEGRFVAPDYTGPWRFGTTPRMEQPPDEAPPTPEDVEALVANYDAGLRAFDGLVGDVRAELERRGLWDSTLVVVLSDHGEHLADEGRGVGHGDHLWGSAALRVPFVLRLPGQVAEGHTVRQRARALDVAPTLLELLGVPWPETFRGRSLASLVRPGAEDLGMPDAPALVESDLWFSDRDGQPYQRVRIPYPWVYETATVEPETGDIALKPEWEAPVHAARHRGLYLGRWKLLELPTPRGIKVELYDVVTDPGEAHDVSADHPEVVRNLRELLARERPVPRMPEARGTR
ncbi:sulfatase family protein [Pyxidicoccus xibeiensis]|uniref:sulfatase family protein n=1 Tax=Pyxidicoccus xibeiensis TaxID=2906759 RepID=UPI0020A704CA|nr:sulfatase [Pyxidicoccus xibeiensis]MCP3142800.1 sulfatase-like hydrolase/transferase [Pyxidicoccus xibeiensis]